MIEKTYYCDRCGAEYEPESRDESEPKLQLYRQTPLRIPDGEACGRCTEAVLRLWNHSEERGPHVDGFEHE